MLDSYWCRAIAATIIYLVILVTGGVAVQWRYHAAKDVIPFGEMWQGEGAKFVTLVGNASLLQAAPGAASSNSSLLEPGGWGSNHSGGMRSLLSVVPEREPIRFTTLRARHGTPGCFVVLTQVFNEGHSMVEWLEHHIAEGASHFYISNNNPRGTLEYHTFRRQVASYVAAGMVTWWHLPYIPPAPMRKMVRSFERIWSRDVLPRIKEDGLAEWLLVVDLDEFFYAPHRPTVSDVSDVLCREVPRGVEEVCAPMVRFENSGFVRQPSCIVPSFTSRHMYVNRSRVIGKCASRLANTTWISVHWHTVEGGGHPPYPKGSAWQKYWGPKKGRGSIPLQTWFLSEVSEPLPLLHCAGQGARWLTRSARRTTCTSGPCGSTTTRGSPSSTLSACAATGRSGSRPPTGTRAWSPPRCARSCGGP